MLYEPQIALSFPGQPPAVPVCWGEQHDLYEAVPPTLLESSWIFSDFRMNPRAVSCVESSLMSVYLTKSSNWPLLLRMRS